MMAKTLAPMVDADPALLVVAAAAGALDGRKEIEWLGLGLDAKRERELTTKRLQQRMW